jgi:cytochrome c oxidase cbb3-type subunit 2
LFAIAGWAGSANGIGMAQSLQYVPPVFVAGAGVVVIGVFILTDRSFWPPVMALCVMAIVAVGFQGSNTPTPGAAMSRGRRVYVAEGCIHCHSQYSRPGSTDERIWGPARPVDEVLKGEPVLIGNRRQGPDLSHVGARRSAAWLKTHFLQPQTLAPDSPMPSYAYLFQDRRGDDLVNYLRESGEGAIGDVQAEAARWIPVGTAGGHNGAALFAANCAACHGTSGCGNGPLASGFSKSPANLAAGPFLWTRPTEALGLRVARVIRFGVPGTDMPGHETLDEGAVLALTAHVLDLRQ